ncbi:MAG: APC family permease [Firmicutes bacterium]|nr:APC family permease [Bacillota bacterium]
MGQASGNPKRLPPKLNTFQAVALALAATSPTASVFLTYGSAWQVAGTGLVLGYAIGIILVFGIAMTYAEGASAYPYTAGGDYSIVSQALGPRIGSIYTSLFLFKGIVIPSVLSLATAAYLQAIFPAIPLTWTAVAVLVVILIFAFEGIRISGWVATAMVILESVVLLGFMVIAALHIHQSLAVLVHPVMMRAGGHALVGATAAGILASVVSALFAYNGWEASLYFSEETHTNPRGVGQTVMVNIALIAGMEFLAILLATLALPDLRHVSTTLPLTSVVKDAIGAAGAVAILAGVVVAQFDSALASTLTYGRIYYAIARDHQWPPAINGFFLRLNRHDVPYGPFVVLGVINLAICLVSQLTSLVIFTGSLLMVLYLGVAVSSFVTHRRDRPAYRMWAWPVPALVAIIGILLVFSQESVTSLMVVAGMVALGLLWSLVPKGGKPTGKEVAS